MPRRNGRAQHHRRASDRRTGPSGCRARRLSNGVALRQRASTSLCGNGRLGAWSRRPALHPARRAVAQTVWLRLPSPDVIHHRPETPAPLEHLPPRDTGRPVTAISPDRIAYRYKSQLTGLRSAQPTALLQNHADRRAMDLTGHYAQLRLNTPAQEYTCLKFPLPLPAWKTHRP